MVETMQFNPLAGSSLGRPRLAPAMLMVVSLLTGACGGNDPPEITPGAADADRILFERGRAALQDEEWLRAREYFVQIRDNYPQSQYRAEARLGVGDTFLAEGTAESYVQALEAFRDFLALYPTHERAPYAQFQIGMVHFLQMRRAERDQSETRSAIQEFETFIERYPSDAQLGEVRAKLREARDRLSDSSFVVGRFYYRNKYYAGAIDRFRSILEEDPGYTRRDVVYFHLADSLARTGETAEAIPYFARLVEEFPQSEYVEQAQRRIEELNGT
jgi:outer membrane protein assembly factor BamD